MINNNMYIYIYMYIYICMYRLVVPLCLIIGMMHQRPQSDFFFGLETNLLTERCGPWRLSVMAVYTTSSYGNQT